MAAAGAHDFGWRRGLDARCRAQSRRPASGDCGGERFRADLRLGSGWWDRPSMERAEAVDAGLVRTFARRLFYSRWSEGRDRRPVQLGALGLGLAVERLRLCA